MGAQRAVAPVLTGSVPPLAPFYHARQETGFGLATGLRSGETILLVPALPVLARDRLADAYTATGRLAER